VNKEGFDPPTPWFEGTCSDPLSYRPHLHSQNIVVVIDYLIQIKFGIDTLDDIDIWEIAILAPWQIYYKTNKISINTFGKFSTTNYT
jgi:hypothetical protein